MHGVCAPPAVLPAFTHRSARPGGARRAREPPPLRAQPAGREDEHARLCQVSREARGEEAGQARGARVGAGCAPARGGGVGGRVGRERGGRPRCARARAARRRRACGGAAEARGAPPVGVRHPAPAGEGGRGRSEPRRRALQGGRVRRGPAQIRGRVRQEALRPPRAGARPRLAPTSLAPGHAWPDGTGPHPQPDGTGPDRTHCLPERCSSTGRRRCSNSAGRASRSSRQTARCTCATERRPRPGTDARQRGSPPENSTRRSPTSTRRAPALLPARLLWHPSAHHRRGRSLRIHAIPIHTIPTPSPHVILASLARSAPTRPARPARPPRRPAPAPRSRRDGSSRATRR